MRRRKQCKPRTQAGQTDIVTAELARLSSDPEITRKPDARFHPKFRDPDEIGDEELEEVGVGAGGHHSPPAWTGASSSRRSPKD